MLLDGAFPSSYAVSRITRQQIRRSRAGNILEDPSSPHEYEGCLIKKLLPERMRRIAFNSPTRTGAVGYAEEVASARARRSDDRIGGQPLEAVHINRIDTTQH